MYVDVYIHKSVKQIDRLFTYIVPEKLKDEVAVGKRVLVPFGRGNRREVAYIIDIKSNFKSQYQIKPILEIMDDIPILTDTQIQLGLFMREQYLTTYMQAFAPLLPNEIIGKVEEIYFPVYPEVSSIFENRDKVTFKELNLNERKEIKKLYQQNLVTRKISISKGLKPKTRKYLITAKGKGKLTDKQQQSYDYILKHEPVTSKEVQMALQISNSPIQNIIRKGYVKTIELIEKDSIIPSKEFKKVTLNSEQEKAYKDILTSQYPYHLLYGITGSGKTEVYAHLVESMFKQGKGVILLLPEISLTPQMLNRFTDQFGEKVSVFHSKLSPSERAMEWSRLYENKAQMVIGARSAVFAPVQNLGLIILDEEQEQSYEFHDALRYDTVEVAAKRVELEGGKLLLGSATPSVTTFYKANTDLIQRHDLKKLAVPTARRPNISIVDMRLELQKGNVSLFSNQLLEKIQTTLNKKEQIILFLNRRGFSQFISCRNCGYVITCDNCDISMTYHKNIKRLRCHYCGATKPMVSQCPECGSEYIKQFGIGTQQVEEQVKKFFPKAKVVRMDRDTMTKKDSYEKIYRDMSNGSIDILIGTQMLAKGFDFKNLTLVGIVAADTSLYFSDYRAQERTFQLITQVSGRTGRSKKPGEVVIQTYSPENYSIKLASTLDYESFYQKEINLRRIFNYPPFTTIFNIIVSSINYNRGMEVIKNWESTFYTIEKKRTLGLEIQKIVEQPKIKKNYRFKIQIKCPKDSQQMLLYELRRVLDNYYAIENIKDVKLDIEID